MTLIEREREIEGVSVGRENEKERGEREWGDKG